MKLPKIDHNAISWVTIHDLKPEQMHEISTTFGFSTLNLEDFLFKTQIPKIEVYPHYTLVVLDVPYIIPDKKQKETSNGMQHVIPNILTNKVPFPSFPKTSKKKRIHIGEINFFIKKDSLIILHDEKTPLVDDLFSLTETNATLREDLMGKGVEHLFYRIVDILVDSHFTYLDDITQTIDTIDKQLEEKPSASVIEDISITRRNIVVFETMIKPSLPIFADLEKGKYSSLSGDMTEYWSNILDHLQKIRERLEDNRELIEGISRSHESLLTVKTNETIKVLTIFTAIMLPLTLLASIYGMNIPLPFEGHVHAFSIILVFMAFLAILMVLIFRLRDWL